MDNARLLKREWSFQDKRNARIRNALDRMPPGPRVESLRKRLAAPLGDVRSYGAERYQIPLELRRTIGDLLAYELEFLLGHVRIMNDRFDGLPTRDGHMLLNGDAETIRLQNSFFDWILRYIDGLKIRLAAGDWRGPVDAFYRGFDEACLLLNDIMCDPDAIHAVILEVPVNFLMWCIAKLTYLPFCKFVRDENHWIIVYSSVDDKQSQKSLMHIVELMGIAHEDSLRYAAAFLKRSLGDAFPTALFEIEQLRNDLQTMADDIAEMRPFLVRGFNPLKALVALSDDCWFVFDWGLEQTIGTFAFATSEREVREAHSLTYTHTSLTLRLDGLLASTTTPWCTAFSEPLEQSHELLVVNKLLLVALHDRLMSSYIKVDIPRFLREKLADAAIGVLSEDDEEAFIAATIAEESASLRDHDVQEPEIETERSSHGFREQVRLRVDTSMRPSALFRVLDILGCTISNGKGSEIKVFRPGGKIYILPHHEGNKPFSPGWIRSLLRRVNVSPMEWAKAMGYKP